MQHIDNMIARGFFNLKKKYSNGLLRWQFKQFIVAQNTSFPLKRVHR